MDVLAGNRGLMEEEKVKKRICLESRRIPCCVRKFIGDKSREHCG
jgi:hypothetical protein